jgi:hypothetical protein
MSQCDHHKVYTIEELIEAGKPLLIESGSIIGSVMRAKEAVWKTGGESIQIEADMEDADSTVARIHGSAPETVVIISDYQAAPDDVKQAIRSNLNYPRKIVVADRKGISKEEKTIFTDLGGHVASV